MCRFTTAAEAEAVRSALDELQQAGAALQELCIRFCEALNDTFVQQLLSQPMAALQRASYELKDAQYSAREVSSSVYRRAANRCSTVWIVAVPRYPTNTRVTPNSYAPLLCSGHTVTI